MTEIINGEIVVNPTPAPPEKKKRKKYGGRQKGTPNKINARIKDALSQSFDELGGVKYLVEVGRTDPKTYCALLAKMLPNEMKQEIIGSDAVVVSVKDFTSAIVEKDNDD